MKQAELIKQTIYEDEFATLWYYPQIKVVHHKFHKFIYGEHFKKILNQGLAFFEKEGCVKWLSDDRNNSALPKEDEIWAQKEWSPKVMKAGWRYWGMILPDKLVGKMNMKRMIASYENDNIRIEIFEDPESALVWLSSVQ